MSIVSKHFTELNPCRGDENVLNNFPRQTGCEGNEIWLLLSFPVGHGLVYPIRIGYAQFGFCPISSLYNISSLPRSSTIIFLYWLFLQ